MGTTVSDYIEGESEVANTEDIGVSDSITRGGLAQVRGFSVSEIAGSDSIINSIEGESVRGFQVSAIEGGEEVSSKGSSKGSSKAASSKGGVKRGGGGETSSQTFHQTFHETKTCYFRSRSPPR